MTFCPTTGRSQFLNYATGSTVMPPLGLTKINITISDDDAVYAATCVNSIKVPNFDNVDYITFKSIMDSIISKNDFTSM